MGLALWWEIICGFGLEKGLSQQRVKYVVGIKQLEFGIFSTVFLLNCFGRHLANIRVFTDRTGHVL
jgi:hypothetical protein